jgi:3-oxoacyl-(acyl-carrier-protein) synthase
VKARTHLQQAGSQSRAQRDGIADGRGGAVAVIQRFGRALNLNVHIHALGDGLA